MYDWPEIRAETDALWRLLRAAFAAQGIAAPERLSRDIDPMALWRAPRLVLAQCCGLPYVRFLRESVVLLGAPDYAVPGCPPGYYCSAIVVRAEDPRERLGAFRGARPAVNDTGSQSGWAALMYRLAMEGRAAGFLAAPVMTGAHRASARAVAEGRADLAALDYVSWRLALRFEPAAARLRVLTLTEPTPGLPMIAASGTAPARYRAILGEVLENLPRHLREALGIHGFCPFGPEDYAPIARRWQALAQASRA